MCSARQLARSVWVSLFFILVYTLVALIQKRADEPEHSSPSAGNLRVDAAAPSSASSSPGPSALFIMSDSREIGRSFKDASFLTLSVVLNYIYAKRHGYELRFYTMPPRDGAPCAHPTLKEERGASWCKLLAVWHAIASAPVSTARVVFLDSDCAILGQHVRLENWLAANMSLIKRHGPAPLDSDLVLLSDYYADTSCDTWCK
jgi:hypothetical protein